MGMGYYDRQGNPMEGTMAWATLSEKADYKRVAQDQVGHFWVSTVWLGLDHSFGSGPPLIFESMVFDHSDSDESDVWCERYSTEEEAREGHARIVDRLVAGTFTNYSDEVLDSTYEITEEPTLI